MREFKKLKEDAIIPKRGTKCSAGYDLYSLENYVIHAGFKPVLVRTGISVKLNSDEFLGLHIRSSIAFKQRLMLINNVGIVDSDYYDNTTNQGEIILPLINLSDKTVLIKKGERIAQGIIQKYFCVDNEEEIDVERKGGFGSTNQ